MGLLRMNSWLFCRPPYSTLHGEHDNDYMINLQGVSKKIVHSDFCFMCVLKLQFYLFICDLESEFGAFFIKILKPILLWILIALKMPIIACVGKQFSLITYHITLITYHITVKHKQLGRGQRVLHINNNSQHRASHKV